MKDLINQLKDIAKNNCCASGDAQASSERLYVVCWDLSAGFQFDVYLDGKPVFGLTEQAIETLLIIHSCAPRVGNDTRSLAA
jgi:hypothetical protein